MRTKLILTTAQSLIVACAMLGLGNLFVANAQSASFSQENKEARKLDEYGVVGECDEGARLDNFAVSLQGEPQTKGYVVVYIGKEDLPGRIPGILHRAQDYLINSRGLDPQRITMINGGYREKRAVELWIAPEGAPAPKPTDTITFTRDPHKAYKHNETYVEPDYPEEVVNETSDDSEDSVVEDQPAVEDVTVQQVEDSAVSDEETEKLIAEAEEAERQWLPETFATLLKDSKSSVCVVLHAEREHHDYRKVLDKVEEGKQLLVTKHGIDASRVSIVFGGTRKHFSVIEIWVVPPGAALPEPTVEVEDEEDMLLAAEDAQESSAVNKESVSKPF